MGNIIVKWLHPDMIWQLYSYFKTAILNFARSMLGKASQKTSIHEEDELNDVLYIQ